MILEISLRRIRGLYRKNSKRKLLFQGKLKLGGVFERKN
jgi:hypothetical protein